MFQKTNIQSREIKRKSAESADLIGFSSSDEEIITSKCKLDHF